MTESPDLTPEQDAVRRLLAEARHDGPAPPEVVARLEETLAGLQAERTRVADTAPVVDLAARRRRFVGAGVLAAAAVVVAGVALGQVLPQGSSDSDNASTAESFDSGGSADSPAGGEDDGGDAAAESPEELSGRVPSPQVLPELSLDDDLDDVLTALRSDSRRVATLSADALVACQVGEVGQGRQVAVRLDGQPGLVVFRAAQGPGQEADVYLCGDPEPVRTLTLPAP